MKKIGFFLKKRKNRKLKKKRKINQREYMVIKSGGAEKKRGREIKKREREKDG